MDLLPAGERFGLELVEQSAGGLKRGSVYVILSRMEAKGFVTSRSTTVRSRPRARPDASMRPRPTACRCTRPTPSCGRRWR
jgi:hypothetical protein